MKNIAIIGECMIELNGEAFGQMQQTYGGDTLNTATYLARLNESNSFRVHYISAVGDDSLSRGIVSKWQADGIDTTSVLIDKTRNMGLYLIQLDEHGERSFLYWRQDSAARYLLQHPDWHTVELSRFDYVYLSGISLAILPAVDRQRLIEALISFTNSGGKLIFDGNYRPALWQSQTETRNTYNALLSHVTLALMTFEDEQALWNDASPDDSISRLQVQGVCEVVMKRGAEGAMYASKHSTFNCPANVIDNVVDTTAAGDAFNAGFLRAYCQDESPEKACQQGNNLAGIVIQHKGAIVNSMVVMKL